ncbi:MAG: dCTP deaminase [Candidatus Omnitrophota bacterium]
MILSNTEIKRAIAEKRIVLTPLPQNESFGTTAVDLRLGNTISIPQVGNCFNLDLSKGSIAGTLKKICNDKSVKEDPFVLEPQKFVLSQTLETISIPIKKDEITGYYLAARVEGKSSLARCGLLVHFTAPTIHAGFEGTITLEIINLGIYALTLQPRMTICQLIFELVLGKPEESPSAFQGQSHPVGSI